MLKLAQADDRSAAEGFAGWYIGAPRAALPPTGPDEHYWGDLVGLAVRGEENAALGRVETLIEAGAHAVLVVRDGETERLVPFVAAIVKRVDVAAGVIDVAWRADW